MSKKIMVSASLLAKSQVAAYTRSDGVMVQAHDNGRQAAAKKPIPPHVQKMVSDVAQSSAKPEHKKAAIDAIVAQHAGGAAAPKPTLGGRPAPAPGDVGHEEHQKYGVYFKKGDKVKDGSGKVHEVMSHRGPEVQTYNGGSFHPTKLSHADAPAAGAGSKKVGVRKSVAKPAAPAKPDWKSAHEDAESELSVASYRGGGKEKAVVALNKAAGLHRAAAKRQAPGDMSPDFHNAHADKLAALAKDHGGGSDDERQPAQKTGSAAPEKVVNIGSEKYPLRARSSDKLPTKHADGSTHHVGGFEAPSGGAGDHFLHHEGKTYSFTGKRGQNMKTGERSFEFAHHDSEKGLEHRAWVTRTGHLMND